MVSFFQKIKSSIGAKDRAELSELSQTNPIQSYLIRLRSIEQITSSLYSGLAVSSGRGSAPRSILSQGIIEMGEVEALEKADTVCVCDI